ncbi:YdeI/OmpD-associated family protein [Natronospira sp.]|uniref:YdeI/OmpD-associated family protein n=1 Tax=Natronospira sp. TaxID=2024970 RepID=UPI0038738C52
MQDDKSNLKRGRQPMPEFVKCALLERGIMAAYDERPPYQRNDYLLWINSAKRQETKEKRLRQMLDELETGGVYMNMKHPASKKE